MKSDAWRAAAWLALAIASFLAALRLIDAPGAVAYQHYRFSVGDDARWAAWLMLATNMVVLLAAGRSHVAAALRWLRCSMSRTTVAIFAMVLVATSAAPSKDPAQYVAEMLFATVLQLLAAFTLVAAARSLPDHVADSAARLSNRLLGMPGAPGPRHADRWSLVVAAFVTVNATLLAIAVYQRHPHVPDEVAYLLHARYLAQGVVAMPAPPVPPGFNIDLMTFEPTRWFSPVPPGWPFVLATGAFLGVPWLVNPILGGVAIVLAYLWLGEMYALRTTRLAVLLLATSPWFLFMSMNFMSHTLPLVCALAAALGVARARRSGTLLPAFFAGLSTGVVSLCRPLEGLVLAILMGFWSLGARGRRFRLAPSVMLTLGAILAGGLVLPYNRALTGNAFTTPMGAYVAKYYTAGANDLGFGSNRGLGWGGLDPFPGHGLRDVVANTLLNASQVNVELLGWPTGSALVIGLLLALGARKLSREDWWQVTAIAAIIASHAFYWFSGGPDFGARYWYLIIVPSVALVARLISRADPGPGGAPSEVSRPGSIATALALVLMVASIVVYEPWRSLGKYYHYRGMRPDVRHLARARGLGASLVLVRGRRFPDYASAAVYNPLDLRAADAPIYAWDATPEIRARLLQAYAGRPVWILDGPSITHSGYRVAAGPLTADELRVRGLPPNDGGDTTHVFDPVYPPSRPARP